MELTPNGLFRSHEDVLKPLIDGNQLWVWRCIGMCTSFHITLTTSVESRPDDCGLCYGAGHELRKSRHTWVMLDSSSEWQANWFYRSLRWLNGNEFLSIEPAAAQLIQVLQGQRFNILKMASLFVAKRAKINACPTCTSACLAVESRGTIPTCFQKTIYHLVKLPPDLLRYVLTYIPADLLRKHQKGNIVHDLCTKGVGHDVQHSNSS